MPNIEDATVISPEDKQAIEELYVRYNRAVDAHDIDSWVATYAPDAIFVGRTRIEGRAAIREFALGEQHRLEARGYARSQHRTSNLMVDSLGTDRAKGECDLLLLHQPIDPRWPNSFLVATYRDEYIRIDGRWHFARRHVDWWPTPAKPARDLQLRARLIRRVRRIRRKLQEAVTGDRSRHLPSG